MVKLPPGRPYMAHVTHSKGTGLDKGTGNKRKKSAKSDDLVKHTGSLIPEAIYLFI